MTIEKMLHNARKSKTEKLPKYMGGSTIHKGGLHKSLGIPEGQKIPASKLAAASKSENPKVRKQAALAKAFKKMK